MVNMNAPPLDAKFYGDRCLIQLTNYIKQSSCLESNRRSSRWEMSRILWKPIVPFRVNNSPVLDPILCQIILLYVVALYLSKVHFNIILPYASICRKCYLPFTFPTKNYRYFSFLSCVLHTRSIWTSLTWSVNNIWWRAQIMKLFICRGYQ
jgi:hypothetical protein